MRKNSSMTSDFEMKKTIEMEKAKASTRIKTTMLLGSRVMVLVDSTNTGVDSNNMKILPSKHSNES